MITVHRIADNNWGLDYNPEYSGGAFIPYVDPKAGASLTFENDGMGAGKNFDIDIKDMITQPGTYSFALMTTANCALRFFTINYPEVGSSVGARIIDFSYDGIPPAFSVSKPIYRHDGSQLTASYNMKNLTLPQFDGTAFAALYTESMLYSLSVKEFNIKQGEQLDMEHQIDFAGAAADFEIKIFVFDNDFQVHTDKGFFDYQHSNKKLYYKSNMALENPEIGEIMWNLESSGKQTQYETRHFLECIKNNTKPLTDARSSIQSLRVIWKLYEAERNNEIADLRGLGLDNA